MCIVPVHYLCGAIAHRSLHDHEATFLNIRRPAKEICTCSRVMDVPPSQIIYLCPMCVLCEKVRDLGWVATAPSRRGREAATTATANTPRLEPTIISIRRGGEAAAAAAASKQGEEAAGNATREHGGISGEQEEEEERGLSGAVVTGEGEDTGGRKGHAGGGGGELELPIRGLRDIGGRRGHAGSDKGEGEVELPFRGLRDTGRRRGHAGEDRGEIELPIRGPRDGEKGPGLIPNDLDSID